MQVYSNSVHGQHAPMTLQCSIKHTFAFRVVTAINYILNKTAEALLDVDKAIIYIVSIIEENKITFGETFNMEDVRSSTYNVVLHRTTQPAEIIHPCMLAHCLKVIQNMHSINFPL